MTTAAPEWLLLEDRDAPPWAGQEQEIRGPWAMDGWMDGWMDGRMDGWIIDQLKLKE